MLLAGAYGAPSRGCSNALDKADEAGDDVAVRIEDNSGHHDYGARRGMARRSSPLDLNVWLGGGGASLWTSSKSGTPRVRESWTKGS